MLVYVSLCDLAKQLQHLKQLQLLSSLTEFGLSEFCLTGSSNTPVTSIGQQRPAGTNRLQRCLQFHRSKLCLKVHADFSKVILNTPTGCTKDIWLYQLVKQLGMYLVVTKGTWSKCPLHSLLQWVPSPFCLQLELINGAALGFCQEYPQLDG